MNYRRKAYESLLCMKMFRPRHPTAVILLVFLAGAASGEDVMKAVGDEVSFRPDKPLPPSVSSFIWKHKNSAGVITKAIEWDNEDGFNIPNIRFQDITTLDEKTGQITITKLKVEHSGVYTIDINSKQQETNFTLTVKEPVTKPTIKIEPSESNPDVVYLICEYNEKITWKNSAGQTLTGSPHKTIGESYTVENKGNPDNFYTCTLKNAVSEETSDPVYERDLFTAKSNTAAIIGAVVGVILIFLIPILLYLCLKSVHESVNACCPCLNNLDFLNYFINKNTEGKDYNLAQSHEEKQTDNEKSQENEMTNKNNGENIEEGGQTSSQ